MSLFRLICSLPGNPSIVLQMETSTDYSALREVYDTPLDETFLLKTKKVYPDKDIVVLSLEERTESTDWITRAQKVEYLL